MSQFVLKNKTYVHIYTHRYTNIFILIYVYCMYIPVCMHMYQRRTSNELKIHIYDISFTVFYGKWVKNSPAIQEMWV